MMDLDTHSLTVEGTISNTGTLRQKKNITTTTEFLHIQNAAGNADKYLGVVITPSGSMSSTTVAIRGHHECTTSDPGVQTADRCFDISPATPQSATIRFYYPDDELAGLNVSTMQAWHWNVVGHSWEPAGSSWTGNDGSPYNYCEAAGVNQYSPFVLRSGGTPTAITVQAVVAQSGVYVLPQAIGVFGVLVLGWVCITLYKRGKV
jgi:hypothetical protein